MNSIPEKEINELLNAFVLPELENTKIKDLYFPELPNIV